MTRKVFDPSKHTMYRNKMSTTNPLSAPFFSPKLPETLHELYSLVISLTSVRVRMPLEMVWFTRGSLERLSTRPPSSSSYSRNVLRRLTMLSVSEPASTKSRAMLRRDTRKSFWSSAD